jgi:hypothetical protein
MLAVAGESAEMKAMGGDRSDEEIDTLLSEGRLSGPTKDRVFEGALRDAGIGDGGAPRARASWRTRLAVTTGLTLATGVAAMILVPRISRQDDAFRVKGAAAALELDVACVGAAGAGSLGACPQGATLVFSIRGDRPLGGYLAGYADPGSGGERIWYFSADGDTPALPASVRDATLPFSKAIRIGPEHAPGEYRVSLFVTRAPLTKTALLSGTHAADIIATRNLTVRIAASRPEGDAP